LAGRHLFAKPDDTVDAAMFDGVAGQFTVLGIKVGACFPLDPVIADGILVEVGFIAELTGYEQAVAALIV